MMDPTLFAAFSVGLAGAGHCLGMCGGIAAALGLGASGKGTVIAYHGGRLLSYTALGAAAGLATGIVDTAAWTLFLRYLAGTLLLAMGLYIADWWRGLAWLERLGARLWRPVQGLASRWLPPRRPRDAVLLGLCWGLMPCGLIYSALALAATRQDPLASGLMMFSFGLGTLPAMLAGSLGARQLQSLLRRRGMKLLIAALLMAAGAWTLYITASHSGHLLAASAGGHAHH
ncbi:sulfite exporter TauE/SafE family protein [Parahaliea mediterranea]|uniref:Sulfite exporter TauE/SafE family protein n=2 Tax=Parahaliea mediterranea TaxID=651086 RepID=A0A939IL59_9GAMM|nr:sulfite exporter TauE/SafE family protein [Parahaliea mediterranea]